MSLLSNKLLTISTLLLIFFFAFICFLGEDASIRVHDNLDSNIIWFKSLADQHLLFADSYTPNQTIMQAPRIAFGSEWSLIAWLFVWFKPIVAYNINVMLMALVAFVGTYFFTKDTLQISPKIAPALALGFSFLPFWFSGGLSAAGQPLLFWCFDKILKKQATWWHWVLILAFPFYSSFILAGLFIIAVIGVFLLYNFLKNTKNIAYIAGFTVIALLTIGYVFVDYRLFLDMFRPTNFVSHRTEFVQGNTLAECIKAAKNSFVGGQTHFPTFHTYLILPVVLVYVVYAIFKKKPLKFLLLCLAFIAVIAVLDGFWNYAGFEAFKAKLPILKAIQLDRFYSLYPLLWLIAFVLIIKELHPKIGIILAMFQALIILFSNQMVSDLEKKILFKKDYISYREFYAEDLFSEIKKVIAPNTKVGMIGLHPAMAQYNKIATVDGYVVLYPLAYKHQIQAIIQPELNQNKFIKTYFEEWGSRCYLFDNEAITAGDGITKNQKCCTDSLDFDFEKLKQLNCGYLLSAVEIKHPAKALELIKKIEDNNWRIWIYKVI